jgi:hypothetical protein
MADREYINRSIGVGAIIFGFLSLSSLFVADMSKIIIPVSEIFIVNYSILIAIINVSLWFIISGLWILRGGFKAGDAKNKIEYEETKARRHVLGTILLSPFLISFFTTIIVASTSTFWKILGILALIYVSSQFYLKVRILTSKRRRRWR